jgi:hypothetical protein
MTFEEDTQKGKNFPYHQQTKSPDPEGIQLGKREKQKQWKENKNEKVILFFALVKREMLPFSHFFFLENHFCN